MRDIEVEETFSIRDGKGIKHGDIMLQVCIGWTNGACEKITLGVWNIRFLDGSNVTQARFCVKTP